MSALSNTPPPLRSATLVRREFIDFFLARGHRFVPSSPVCPLDDPTLLFTNAGMNQFKDVFLGTGRRDYTRAVNSQKCLRVSGKHNDLEEVGLDTYHHTFFEMLGNWSFGDYFKPEAIRWAWELLTGVWGLPRERLWVTVFGGDSADDLPPDEETERLWREVTDIDPARVLRFGRKDNFWEMGPTGPCGPCTEIHIDRGAAGADPREGADPARGVNAGNERFVELWNNVFIQFNRLSDASLAELPSRHVDTGLGFERVLGVLQKKASNYDTDLFTPIFARIESATGARYGRAARADVAFRVIADHLRALSSAIADGALPSNEGRGYVLRRLLRRASRFGRQTLDVHRPFLFEVAPAVGEVLGGAFPEIRARMDHIQLVVKAEEESFGATLDRGLVLFGELAAKVAAGGARELSGERAYDLYATYGFPQDLVEQMLRERGWTLDRRGWDQAEQAHKAASRSEGQFKQALSADELARVRPTRSTYHEPGEEGWRIETEVLLATEGVGGDGGERGEGGEQGGAIVLAESPFYAEGGGQIGDSGAIEALDGSLSFEVRDARRIGSVVVHRGAFARRPASLESCRGTRVKAVVDREKRERTRKNHTATHLLHKALKDVLGAHVSQQGSYVGPDRLRFDFSHPKAVTPAELEQIERLVNERVFDNAPVKTTVEDLEAAKARGVVAMFGEKYEQKVRVLDVGGWSLELCGGTHVRAAGDIGPFVIVSERAIQAGVRRVEALSGAEAVAWIQGQRRALQAAARALKTAPEEVGARIEALQGELKDARRKGAAGAKADVGAAFERLKGALVERGGVASAVLDYPELDLEPLGDLASRARTASKDLALVLFGRSAGRVPLIVMFEGRALQRGLKAGEVAGKVAKALGGGGGGRPNLAQGQGVRAEAVPEAVALAQSALQEALGS